MIRATLALCLIPLCLATNVSKCTNGIGLPFATNIKDCTDQPCTFRSDRPVVADIYFDVPDYIEEFKPAVSFKLGASDWFPFEVELNGCDLLQGYRCPLEEGERPLLRFQMDVPPIPVDIGLQFGLTSGPDTEALMTCFTVNATVVVV